MAPPAPAGEAEAAPTAPRPADVLLVGSVPLGDADCVLRTCGEHFGGRVLALPDGETGDRSQWVVFQAHRVFSVHPDVETISRPSAPAPGEAREAWMPGSLTDNWEFRVRPGRDRLEFGALGYAAAASASYLRFRALRAAGAIAPHVRFQVCLPLPLSGVGFFFRGRGEVARVAGAYRQALLQEAAQVVAAVPARDLAVQWDACWEVLDLEGFFPWAPPGDPWRRFADDVAAVSRVVPPAAAMGIHLCYADLGHRHMKEPKDLALAAAMAARAREASTRSLDYVHMPVPRGRDDDAYFRPLRGMDFGETRLFLGLVHHTDGVEGSLRRLAAAKRHCKSFGVATECGFGRRDPKTVPELFRIHTAVAGAL